MTSAMLLSDYDFDLPAARIAQHPQRPRDAARLLAIDQRENSDRHFWDLPNLLRPGDLLVVNDTRVIPARLSGRRGEAGIEVTLHKQQESDVWRAFAKPARRLHIGDRIDFPGDLSASVQQKGEGGEVILAFDQAGGELASALEAVGTMPLPPYIKRGQPNSADSDDYQTVFATHPGAVAAPTAGLHFTPSVLTALKARGVDRVAITLHVGAGTFLPVRSDDVTDHVMHAEWGSISADAAAAVNRTRARGGRVIAGGTTALRLLESAAAADGTVQQFEGDTDLFILPGYRFKVVRQLLTNFHLPKSTLFMLVCAFAGTARMKAAYRHAVAAEYRFYSYGDACLLNIQDAA
jgi:S-adenosylmethionine:tRNA ribosyltransferase-isomerase